MSGAVNFTNGITFSAGGLDLMNPEVTAILDQDLVSREAQEAKTIVDKMGFKRHTPLNPNEKFKPKVGADELEETPDGEMIPLGIVALSDEKGYTVVPFSKKFEVSPLMYDWLLACRTLQGADSNVKAEYIQFSNNVKDLLTGYEKIKAIRATQVYTAGFSITAASNGGSATPKGKALFATDQPYGQGAYAGTFRNVLGGTDYGTLNDDLNATSLQFGLDLQTTELRLQNGDSIVQPPEYKLIVNNKLAKTARSILNASNQRPSMYAGTGSNANLLNTFDFEGNSVELVTNSFIGFNSRNYGPLGAKTNWFLANSYGAQDQMALLLIMLNSGNLNMWIDNNTAKRYVSYYTSLAVDHYYAESFIIGSQGTA